MAPFKLSQKNRNPSTLPSMHNPWILLSGLLIFLGNIPYIVSILRKETVPNRASWWIWATENLLAWIFWTVGAGLSLFAIDAWTVSSALFILYIFVSNTIVLCILLHDR